jgi:hypothetical protein
MTTSRFKSRNDTLILKQEIISIWNQNLSLENQIKKLYNKNLGVMNII